MDKDKELINPVKYLKQKLLTEMGLPIAEVARALNLSYVSASKIFNGHSNITVATALRMETVFGIPAEELMKIQWAWTFEEEKNTFLKSKEFKKLKKFEKNELSIKKLI